MLKTMRKDAGYSSPDELCRALAAAGHHSLSSSSVYRYEAGEHFPTIEALSCLAAAFPSERFMAALAFCLYKNPNIEIVSRNKGRRRPGDNNENQTRLNLFDIPGFD
jgi:hypothetical protein